MELVAHRINTLSELKSLPPHVGVEIDIRPHRGDLILAHDPFVEGERVDDYLHSYCHGTIILNIKSERIEWRVLELLKKYKIQNYFFLDSSFPMIYQLSQSQEKNIAIRFSEFESIETVLSMSKKVHWVWVDCFTLLPICNSSFMRLKDAGFKLCLVSPELQGRPQDIERYRTFLNENSIYFDAVCTKFPYLSKWT